MFALVVQNYLKRPRMANITVFSRLDGGVAFSLGVKTFGAERLLSEKQPSRPNYFTLIGCLSCSLARYNRSNIAGKALALLPFSGAPLGAI